MLGFMSLHHESTFDFTSVNFTFFLKKQTNKQNDFIFSFI